MIIMDMPQQSEEWFAEKFGKPSSSQFGKILTSQGKRSASRTEYMCLLADLICKNVIESSYTNEYMEEGNRREPESRALFEFIEGVEVQEVGVVYKDDRKRYLCSPDGLIIGREEGLELKNPKGSTHLTYLKNGKLPAKYFPQVQGSMYITGYKHWRFMSHHPGYTPFIINVERDDAWCEKLGVELELFCDELDQLIEEQKGE